RRLRDGEAERTRDLRSDRDLRARGIEPHAAAEEIVGAEKPERKIAVRDGRPITAAVAGGARHCARAVRPDLERTEGVDARDGAAAGAHRVDVHHRHRDVAAFDLAAVRYERL